jgi:hypothetical protein
VKPGEIENPILLGIREKGGILALAYGPQYPVHKRNHVPRLFGFYLFDRLVHDRRLRNPAHEKDLVHGQPEDVENGRINLSEGKIKVLFDDPVEAEPPTENP